ncbi:urease accessory protein UreD [Marinibactrum halimedae]|uniref:Urease accessory protein UreD n=1 Tax=Marinibactrum halimedae TaxID=1444977 RepID=A0AA37WM19_9GAMM|nr:urease accessory protein UreD [Marinibactrum halimedae]MCD9460847.1 urease accessory protein UreD [Marinibactrum halimedae]GLS26689.1 urease accessory protein UreD 2 [Marinibactrum halimedae]
MIDVVTSEKDFQSVRHPISGQFESTPQYCEEQWHAKLFAEIKCSGNKAFLGKTDHYGPLRIQRPFFPEGRDCLHLYLLHPPGGLVGGDSLSISFDVKERSHCLVTTPSAGKIYRNIRGLPQVQNVGVNVHSGAKIEYFPQENIIYDGAEAHINTSVELKGDGVFCGWEITCIGRYESSDPFVSGSLKQSFQVTRDGTPVFSDRLILTANSSLQSGVAGLQGKCVAGTFLITTDLFPIDEALSLEQKNLQKKIVGWQTEFMQRNPDTLIAMTQKPMVWIVRALGNRAEKIRQVFEMLWAMIRPYAMGRPVCVPRIWCT